MLKSQCNAKKNSSQHSREREYVDNDLENKQNLTTYVKFQNNMLTAHVNCFRLVNIQC